MVPIVVTLTKNKKGINYYLLSIPLLNFQKGDTNNLVKYLLLLMQVNNFF